MRIKLGNAVIGGKTTFRFSSNTYSPVTVKYDAASITTMGNGVWGYTTIWWSNYKIVKAEVKILPEGTWYGYFIQPKYELYLHEFGHVVGFAGHTREGGVMDAFYNGSLTITETVRQVLSSLYNLPPGYALTKAPSSVPPDGMVTIIFKN